jgi:malonyl-CoA/methylmalonyl-CoA synthetase
LPTPHDLGAAIDALGACAFIADCTVEGLMHAPELPRVLKGGARMSSSRAAKTSIRRNESDVLSLFHDRLARYKYPRRALFVDELPKNALGKVQKFELKRRLGAV